MLNALLGVGTALAPVLVAIFIHIGIWWGLPVLVATLVFALLLSSLRLPLRAGTVGGRSARGDGGTGLPSRFWIFAVFALVYGILETMSGNWAAIYMSRSLGATTLAASFALTVFWAMVTAGRLLFAGIETWLPEHRVYRLLPIVIAVAFGVIAWLPKGDSIPGILAFGLAGLGCSALLPLTISFGQGEMTTIAASVAGGLIAFYQLGYGMTAFGIGPLQEHAGLSLDVVFGFAAVVALVLTALSFVISRHDASALSRLPRGA
jgi:fucose permease